MKEVKWNIDKNAELMKIRNITFEQLLNSRFIGIERHPIRKHQKLMIFEHNNYVWVIPYIEERDYYFLKTAFPSRKHTKRYLGGE